MHNSLQTSCRRTCPDTIQEYTSWLRYQYMKVCHRGRSTFWNPDSDGPVSAWCISDSIDSTVSQHILGGFDEGLQEYASKRFQREGITLKKGHHVERVEAVSCLDERPMLQVSHSTFIALPCQTKLVTKEEGEGMFSSSEDKYF